MFINVDGQKTYCQRIGSGPNLLLLHGWAQDVSTFWPLVDLLKDSFTLWLVDLPGFGRSDPPALPWRVEDYARHVANLIAVAEIAEPIVLGHSLGGRVAIKLASNYPEKLSKLILEDSAGLRPKRTMKQPLLYLTAKGIKFLVPNWFNLKARARYKLYRGIGSDYGQAGSLRDTFLNIVNEDLAEDMKRVETDTLILWGERDRAVPLSDGKRIYQLIKNARMEVIEGAGHFPHLEKPQLFVYYVKDFC